MKYIAYIVLGIFFCSINYNASAQEKKKVSIKHADKFIRGKNHQKLIDNVVLQHKDVTMFCDSAYLSSKTNIVKAFGHIHIVQSDTLHLYGDELTYYTKTRFAKVRKNVVLKDRKLTLKTDSLDYDSERNIAYYNYSGVLLDSINHLTSIIGQYYAKTNRVSFKKNVEVTNPDYKLYSDTLNYNTVSKIVNIEGPTYIVGKKDTIYSEEGWYNTLKKQVQLSKNNKAHRESYFCYGDNIFLDNIKQTAVIKNNGVLKDTVNNIILKAHNIKAFNKEQFAIATEKSHLIYIDKNRDSLFMRGDTITLRKDSLNTKINSFHNIRFYKKNLQGVCDSLSFSMKDSLTSLYTNPILWVNGQQITGDTIKLQNGGKAMKKFFVYNKALIISSTNDNKYNQIKGKNMIGYFKNNFLNYLDVLSSSQLIYFPIDKGVISGVYKTVSSNIRIYIKKRKLDRIIFKTTPNGNIYPLNKIEARELKLKEFRWDDDKRPKNKKDIIKDFYIKTAKSIKFIDKIADKNISTFKNTNRKNIGRMKLEDSQERRQERILLSPTQKKK